jgi:hypothetical protein
MEEKTEYVYKISVISAIEELIAEGCERNNSIKIYEGMTGETITKDSKCEFGGNKRKLCHNVTDNP